MSLPSGYKRLEYIQNTGTQYIDTGIVAKSSLIFRVKFNMQSTKGHNIAGLYVDSNHCYRFFTYNNQGYLDIGFDSRTRIIGGTIQYDTVYEMEAGNCYIEDLQTGETVASGTAVSEFTLSGNVCLGGTSAEQENGKYYYLKIYDGSNLVRDMVPCINASGEIGLWDDVNGVFYGNAGTGTFEAGPEVGVSTPENFRLSSSTETTAMLAWSAVGGATGYKLYRDGILIATLTDTSYTDTIQPFTSYLYALTAYNDSGESDPATISVQVIIPPEAPSNFRASSASMAAIALAWDAVTGAESYQLSRDGVVIYTGEYPSYTDSGLTAETAYTYTLTAFNSAGSSVETTLEATTTKFVLVTDRTVADVNAGNDKGTYKASDLNRVGAAMNYVADRLRAAGYDPHISPKTDWKDGEWVDPEAQAVYLGDLAELRKQFTMLESTPEVPPRILATGIRTNDGLTYVWANNIEQILVDIDVLLTNIAAGWLYSGEIYSGEV